MNRENKTDVAINKENKTDVAINKKRCIVCNKKLPLGCGFKCKCNGMFCALHRGENDHDCSFNFAEAGMNGLSGQLIVIGCQKIAKIGV